MPNAKPYSLPITVGVTGHRQIAPTDIEAARQAVTVVLDELHSRWPTTPILLLSGLAEGADRLVAQIALDRYGAELIAVLPMAVDEFRKDFATEESKTEFNVLLARAQQVVMPRKAHGELAEERHIGYQAVGEWIALHSHLLIALWDGDTARGRGGTAEIVAAKLKGRYSNFRADALLTYDEGGAVAHVHVQRPDHRPTRQTTRVKWLYPEMASIGTASGQRRFRFVLENFELLNRHLAKSKRTREGWVASQQGLKEMNLEALKASASRFAASFQRHTHVSILYMACATMVAAVASPFEDSDWWTIATFISISALVSGFSVWALAHWSQWQRLHTDFRAIAEACRVQAVWLACGTRECIADQYHPVQAGSVAWIRRALRTGWLLDGLELPGMAAAMPEPAGFGAGRRWIEEQKTFFLGRYGVVPRYHRRARHFAILSAICLGFGLLVWVGGNLLGIFAYMKADVDFGQILFNLGKVVLAAGASLHAYQVFMAFSDLQRSYAISAHLFSIAADELEQLAVNDDRPGLKRLILELGRAALVENVSWLLTRRQRHLMPPVG